MKRFKNILYVANSSGIVLKAFHHAVDLAERNDARLTVLMVMAQIPSYLTRLTPYMLRRERIKEQKAALDTLCGLVSGRVDIEAKIVEGTPFLEIIREVLRFNRDLVVKLTDGDAGVLGRLFGTDDMHLLRKCPCPVWLIKSAEPTPIKRILAAVDFNEPDPSEQDTAEPLNRKILELAGSLAAVEHSELHVVHAWFPIGERLMLSGRMRMTSQEIVSYIKKTRRIHRRWLDQLMRKAKKWVGRETYEAVKPKTHMPKGYADEVIPALSGKLKIDLVIMGTVARTGIPGLIIGNTAEGILEQIDCSVLAVKPEGFVSPVAPAE